MSENHQWVLFVSGALAGAVVVGGAVLASSAVFTTMQRQTIEAINLSMELEERDDVKGRRISQDKRAVHQQQSPISPLLRASSNEQQPARRSSKGKHNLDRDSSVSIDLPSIPMENGFGSGVNDHSSHHAAAPWNGNGSRPMSPEPTSPARQGLVRQGSLTAPSTPSIPTRSAKSQELNPNLSGQFLKKWHSQDSNLPSRMHARSNIISLDLAPVGPSSNLARDLESEEMIGEMESVQEGEFFMNDTTPDKRGPSLCHKRPLTPGPTLEEDVEGEEKDQEDYEVSGSGSGEEENDEGPIGQDNVLNMLNVVAPGPDQVAGPSDRANRWGVEMVRMHTVEEMLNCEVEASKKEAPPKYARLEHRGEFELNQEGLEVCELLEEALEMRKNYVFTPQNMPQDAVGWPTMQHSFSKEDLFEWKDSPDLVCTPHEFEMKDGVMVVYDGPEKKNTMFKIEKTANEFFRDMLWLLKVVASGPVKTLSHHRLLLLEQRFSLHVMLNADTEFLAQKTAPHRDFYNVRKVDTHIHHSACMNQKHLLRFIKSKLRKEPDEVVIYRDGKYLTLKEVFESLNLTGYDLNVDTLDMHADKNTFHRFDKFNLKYNPCGQSRLREIFIKQDNLIHGRFLAELTREVFSDLEATKYTFTEYRISVYGRKLEEWDSLAAWICNNRLHSEQNIWLIQLPRLYAIYKQQGTMNNFQNMLDNIFIPLFEVTKDPNSHPQLHLFLKQVVGFDMVDDESRPERRVTKHMKPPQEWDSYHNPAYAYYAYYVYANLTVLNKFRESKGYNTLSFRPHAGEAGDIDHLATVFFLANEIAHGNNLRKSPGLQYLFYLAQIGLAMSPLSNNSLFLDYHRNPFPTFFSRGLNVTLSTDDPLQIHLTKEPLVEEYSIAAQVWKLSSCDLCEIARNSVLQSGFPHQVKQHWVSDTYWLKGPEGNEIRKTNVPSIRMQFRKDVLDNELRIIREGASKWQHQNEVRK